MAEVDTPKISVRIAPELHQRMGKVIPRGMQNHLLASLLEVIVGAIEDRGPLLIGAIMAGQFKLIHQPDDNEITEVKRKK